MRYTASEYRAKGGGVLLLEKAVIKRNNTPLLLAAVCEKAGEDEKRLLREMGEWFQNKAVPFVLSGKGDFSLLCEDPGMEGFTAKCEADGLGFVFAAGEKIFLAGENVFLVQKQFGKPALVSAGGEDGGFFEIDKTVTVLITDGYKEFNKDELDCLISADSGERMERAVLEVSCDKGENSFICFRAQS